MAVEIIPALLVDSAAQFESQLRAIEDEVSLVQIDILDGSMFDKQNWFDPVVIGKIPTKINYELHLMVENPLPVVEEFVQHCPNTVRAIIHAELDRPLGTLIELIQQNFKLEAGVALNPETPLEEIHHVVPHLNEALIMGVHPGASGQAFGDALHGISGEAIYEKIAYAHERYPDLVLGVDGGVNAERAPRLVSSGATRLCANSAIFRQDDPVEALRKLQKIANLTG